MKTERELELYIHIPFCIRKCAYCDFLSAPSTETVRKAYVDALCREIRLSGEEQKDALVTSAFIGGGTPSVLTARQTEQILEALGDAFRIRSDAEISMEVNPGTTDRDRLSSYKKNGINRLSIGLQSANDNELQVLGRIHDYAAFQRTFQEARQAGFTNLNVDLMAAIPGQTLRSYEESLKKVLSLQPEHISAYSLILEEGTPFYEWYQEGKGQTDHPALPEEEEERRMYERTHELLTAEGYHRYEISNYAKPDRECRHNIGYWKRKEYLGLGIGAASLIRETRFTNIRNLTEYIACIRGGGQLEQIRENYERLGKQNQIEETMILGLRMEQGVSLAEFEQRYGVSMMELYRKVIEKYTGYGLLNCQDGYLHLTERGISVSNVILADFLFD